MVAIARKHLRLEETSTDGRATLTESEDDAESDDEITTD